MVIEKFEDIIAWQKSKELTLCIYSIFRNSQDFGFKDQIQRVCISIMNNIAEGFDRRGDEEFKHFLCIAKGSCSEVRSMLYLVRELKYINENNYLVLINTSFKISKLLNGLIKSLK
jgi:four helix bundle protein